MSLFAKKRVIHDDAMAKERDLKIEVTVRVLGVEQYETKVVTDIAVQQSLISTSDSKDKDLLEEIENVLAGVVSATEEKIRTSRYLSDGQRTKSKEVDPGF
jgi:hypothetical protein